MVFALCVLLKKPLGSLHERQRAQRFLVQLWFLVAAQFWQPGPCLEAPALSPHHGGGLQLLGIELMTHFRALLGVTQRKVLFGSC